MSLWVAGGTVVAGIGGSLIAANGSKQAAAGAAAANLANTQATNEANYRMFNEGRGAPGADGFGHSILPNYFGGNEQDLAQQAYANFQRLNGAGQDNYNALRNYQSGMQGSLNNSLTAFGNRFNGQDLAQRIGFADPFYQARLSQAQTMGTGMRGVASANSSAINTSLMQTIARINAGRARQGFLGSSTFDRNQLMANTLGARQAAAVGTAQANAGANNVYQDALLQNAGDLRGLQNTDLDTRGRVDLFPGAMNAVSQFQNAPANALANSFNTATQPLNFFRISPQGFQQQNMPQVSPGLDNGQIFGSALSSLSSGLGNAYFMNQLSQRYGPQPTSPASTAPLPTFNSNPFGTGAGTSAPGGVLNSGWGGFF